jgi:hypothetical protein
MLTPGATALALLDNTVAARERPHESVRIVKQAAVDAVGLTGVRGEADGVVQALLDALETT